MKNLDSKYGLVGAGFIAQNPYLDLLGIVLMVCFVLRPIISLISPVWGGRLALVQFSAAILWLGIVAMKLF